MIEAAQKTAGIFCRRRGIPQDQWEDYQQEAVAYVLEHTQRRLKYYLMDYYRQQVGVFINGAYNWDMRDDPINIEILENDTDSNPFQNEYRLKMRAKSLLPTNNGTEHKIATKGMTRKILNSMELTSKTPSRDKDIMLEYLTIKPTMRSIGKKHTLSESRISQIVKSTTKEARQQAELLSDN